MVKKYIVSIKKFFLGIIICGAVHFLHLLSISKQAKEVIANPALIEANEAPVDSDNVADMGIANTLTEGDGGAGYDTSSMKALNAIEKDPVEKAEFEKTVKKMEAAVGDERVDYGDADNDAVYSEHPGYGEDANEREYGGDDCLETDYDCYNDYEYPEYENYGSSREGVDPVVAVADPIPDIAHPLVTVVNSDYCNNCYDPDCDCYYDYGYPGYWDNFPLRTRRYEYYSKYGKWQGPRYGGYRERGNYHYQPLDRNHYRLKDGYGYAHPGHHHTYPGHHHRSSNRNAYRTKDRDRYYHRYNRRHGYMDGNRHKVWQGNKSQPDYTADKELTQDSLKTSVSEKEKEQNKEGK